MQTTLTLTLPQGIRSFAEYQQVCTHLAAQQLACAVEQIQVVLPPQVFGRIQQSVQVYANMSTTTVQGGAEPVQQAKALRSPLRTFTVAMYSICAVLCMAVIAYAWVRISELQHTKQSQQQQTVQLQQTISAMQTTLQQVATQPSTPQSSKLSPTELAYQHTQQNLNPVFVAIESVSVPQVRLRSLSMNTQQRTAQVTYQLGNLAQAPTVNQALNQTLNQTLIQPQTTAPATLLWQLKSVNGQTALWHGVW